MKTAWESHAVDFVTATSRTPFSKLAECIILRKKNLRISVITDLFCNVSRSEQYIHHSYNTLISHRQRIQRIFCPYLHVMPLSLSRPLSFLHILQRWVFVSVEMQFMVSYHSAVHMLNIWCCCCSLSNNNIFDVKTVERMHFTVGSQSAGKEILGHYEWWCVRNMIKCGIIFFFVYIHF